MFQIIIYPLSVPKAAKCPSGWILKDLNYNKFAYSLIVANSLLALASWNVKVPSAQAVAKMYFTGKVSMDLTGLSYFY